MKTDTAFKNNPKFVIFHNGLRAYPSLVLRKNPRTFTGTGLFLQWYINIRRKKDASLIFFHII